ncbi:granulocyte-macrophage colony-stimulating factor receptor subunit alpha [Choloepus didactylus]|uniref:granulocyte-macrophage colony-stimulating factor receptor subunit alpha n=1 Tax=Choloepus didactylus TaxID=27675 RepID=UPI00189F552A|nr:granulocyte-macrophage colony-stimulating factor receptor subunit alpha [Choloepus didactylus]
MHVFITCFSSTPFELGDLAGKLQVQENNTYFCIFSSSVLHRGAILSVNVISNGDTFQEVLIFNNSGKEGSGAVSFSCFIYNICFMNCSWLAGPAAPVDVQYHLYKWDTWDGEEVECPHYLSSPTGMHVGCHFDKLSKPNRMDNYFFLLNGTSSETAIQFLDFAPFTAYLNEKYNPPPNITISYNGSNHIIQWDNPKMRFDINSHVLYYELDLQKKGISRDPVFQTGADTNVYLVPSSDATAENTLRMRVKHLRSSIWSDWSEVLHFEITCGVCLCEITWVRSPVTCVRDLCGVTCVHSPVEVICVKSPV